MLPGEFTPTIVESMARLGARLTFVPAAEEIRYFNKVDVSAPTERRNTEKAGDAYVEVQAGQLAALERELPPAPQGPPLQQMSVDGALVPLLHREWAEVKTMAIGTVGEPVLMDGNWEVHARELSYFSRLADHEVFTHQALLEAHRRGIETAGTVCAVNDGAEWEQKFVDFHRPDAVRILDWGHSSGYVATAGQAVFGEGTPRAKAWIGEQLHELEHGDPQKVLAELHRLQDDPQAVEGGLMAAGSKAVTAALEYLEKRQDQIRYAEFRAKGYPIGSGAVESGNKLVVEARMKGAGMHWQRSHVNGIVGLRNALCSGRWEEAWPQISTRLRQKALERSAERRVARMETALTQVKLQLLSLVVLATPTTASAAKATHSPARTDGQVDTPTVSLGRRRPAPDHPWRRPVIRRATNSRASSIGCADS